MNKSMICGKFLAKIKQVLEESVNNLYQLDLEQELVKAKKLLVSEDPNPILAIKGIVDQVFEDRDLGKKVNGFLKKKRELAEEAETWDLFFNIAYDKVVLFAYLYQDLLIRADNSLPRSGLIVDFGSGTGNFVSYLAFRAKERRLIGLDISQSGLDLSLSKANVLPSRNARFLKSDLKKPLPIEKGTAIGAILNNVLYRFEIKDKISLLKQIYDTLEPGGILVLSDPLKEIQKSEKKVREFLEEGAISAVNNGASLTVFDVAVIASLNRMFVIAESPPFLTMEELSNLAYDAGFQLKLGTKPEYVYGNTNVLLVLQKPL